MIQNNKNKFNRTNKAFKNFPFKKFIFDTSKHPIVTSKERCSHRLNTLSSHQEIQILEGLISSLQTEQREAIRISIYEAHKNSIESLENNLAKYIDQAKSTTKEKGHTSRDKKVSLSLPKQEKDNLIELSKKLSITEKEALRLCIIWLRKETQNETITYLTNSKRIGQLDLRRQWSKENKGKPSSIKPLLEAQTKGLAEAEERRFEEYEKNKHRHEEAKEMSTYMGVPYEVAQELIDRDISLEGNEFDFAEFAQGKSEEDEFLDLLIMFESQGFSEEDAEWAAKEVLAERKAERNKTQEERDKEEEEAIQAMEEAHKLFVELNKETDKAD
jgi:hypothetical protein